MRFSLGSEPQKPERGKILTIDDDRTLTTLLSARLSDQGYDVKAAANGEEGIAVYRDFRPDIILLDILMPKVDGYSFIQNFKQIGGNLKMTPVIVLTSRESMQDIFAMEGINDYMVKPFNMEVLQRKIDKRMQSRTKKILVADDSGETVGLIEDTLTTRNYDVLTAFNGLDAFEKAKKEKPDLMVLDVMMPKLDGYNVCRMLKFDEKYKNISVVLLTALAGDTERKLGHEVGADICLTKPYDGNTLLHTVKELLWD